MVGYSFMPTLGEWFMERGWTFAYLDLDVTDVKGAATFAACFAAYIFLVEWGIYWAHRGLHEHKGLYMLLHRPHVSEQLVQQLRGCFCTSSPVTAARRNAP